MNGRAMRLLLEFAGRPASPGPAHEKNFKPM